MTKRRTKKAPPAETPSPEIRDEHGRFRAGCSGNPGGRPAVAAEIIELAKGDSPKAYSKVVAIMKTDGSKHQLAAALAILKIAGVFRAAEDPKPLPPLAPTQAPTDALMEGLGPTEPLN